MVTLPWMQVIAYNEALQGERARHGSIQFATGRFYVGDVLNLDHQTGSA